MAVRGLAPDNFHLYYHFTKSTSELLDNAMDGWQRALDLLESIRKSKSDK